MSLAATSTPVGTPEGAKAVGSAKRLPYCAQTTSAADAAMRVSQKSSTPARCRARRCGSSSRASSWVHSTTLSKIQASCPAGESSSPSLGAHVDEVDAGAVDADRPLRQAVEARSDPVRVECRQVVAHRLASATGTPFARPWSPGSCCGQPLTQVAHGVVVDLEGEAVHRWVRPWGAGAHDARQTCGHDLSPSPGPQESLSTRETPASQGFGTLAKPGFLG